MAQNGGNQEDIVDTIAQYDLDEDFPDYANEQNKELNQIVSKPFNCQTESNLQPLYWVDGGFRNWQKFEFWELKLIKI